MSFELEQTCGNVFNYICEARKNAGWFVMESLVVPEHLWEASQKGLGERFTYRSAVCDYWVACARREKIEYSKTLLTT